MKDLAQKIEEYKSLMMDISMLFLQYLLLKKSSGEYTDEFLEKLYPLYLNFKFSRYKLVYGIKTDYAITKDEIWQNAEQQIKNNPDEIELNNLEEQVFSNVINVSSPRWNRTFEEIQ